MDVGAVPNAGRPGCDARVDDRAERHRQGVRDCACTSNHRRALGRQLRNMEHVLSEAFVVERSHSKAGNTWTFDALPTAVDDD